MKKVTSQLATNPIEENLTPLQLALDKCSQVFTVVFVFSFCVNLLMLITPLYSLQVLDRVIGSGNLNTLLMLSIIIGTIYFSYSMLQIARSFVQIKMGEWLDRFLSPILFAHNIAASALRQASGGSQILRDFQQVKSFLTSTGINLIFDAPWSIVYIGVIFMIHPYIGWLTVAGSIIVIFFAFLNAIATNRTIGEANDFSIKGMNNAEVASRNAEAVEAMGMIKNVTENWRKFNEAALQKQSHASYKNGIISNLSRFIRNILQMAVTGIGAYVVVKSNGADMTTGGMIASSIMVGRALAPFDNAIEMWKNISSTMKSYQRIQAAFKHQSLRDSAMPIPDIEGRLTVDNVYYTHPVPEGAPQQVHPKYILNGVSFNVEPGEVIAIIGPSAAGKSTLAKIIVGVWKATSGNVRLDGGEIYRWNREDFGKYIGYLPQGIELFSGSIKENIARMEENPDPKDVVDASKMSGAHELVLKFADGYDSDIGVAGSNLSGGQKQRIGLARAFYKVPKLVILDEPNANLDELGEIALANALKEAKAKKMAVIVISHRPSVLSVVDKILVLQNGSVAAFGKKEEIMSRITSKDGSSFHLTDDAK
jgi:PrtD family type I secretion system ABC transporter